MKNIEIKGKRNIDILEQKENNKKPIRLEINKYKYNKKYIHKIKQQIGLLNDTWINTNNNNSVNYEEKKELEKILEKKRKGYYYQDIDKKIYQEDKFISLEVMMEKMIVSKLKCEYCSKQCLLLYEEVMCKDQWTLDRINNDYGHNENNVVISCLRCNIQRKTMDKNRFEFGKKLKIKKTD